MWSIVMIGAAYGIGTCIAGLALMASGAARAVPCWDAPAVAAAQISELETMLLVTSLRCRAAGFDFHESYERFTEVYRSPFRAAQRVLRAHFGADISVDGRRAYDSYLISVANFYGAGTTDAATCNAFETVNGELGSAAAQPGLLPLIAMEMLPDPQINGPRCPAVEVVRAPAAISSH
jgi:hypothetical protein